MPNNYCIHSYDDDGVTTYKCFHCQSSFSMRYGNINYCVNCGIKFEEQKSRAFGPRKTKLIQLFKTHPKYDHKLGDFEEDIWYDIIKKSSVNKPGKIDKINCIKIKTWSEFCEDDFSKNNIDDWVTIHTIPKHYHCLSKHDTWVADAKYYIKYYKSLHKEVKIQIILEDTDE